MNRMHWYVALLQVGLLAIFACSSDDSADTSGAGGADSGADHSAAGGASGAAPDSSVGGAQPDSNLVEASVDSSGAPPDNTTDASVGDATVAADTPSDSPCGNCPNGVCLEGGICASCTGDLHCQGGAWRCDLTSHTCVQCLPGVTDNCPVGQYCTAAFACAPGCKGNASCASGTCTNHECDHCQNDLECSSGHVCGTGVCAPACTVQGGCSSGFDCCAGHCVSLARDIQHCGGCASACDLTQFCNGTGCAAATIANVCSNAKTTMILDNYPPDDASGAVLQGGVTSNCVPAPTTASSSKGSPGPVNPTTGQPVEGGGNLLTVAGGYYVQPLVDYFDKIGLTAVYLERDVSTFFRYFQRGGGAAAGPDGGASDALVAEVPRGSTTHDIILIETVRDPSSGTLVLIAYGQFEESTAAAARYVVNQMLPVANRAMYTKSWYVYEWTAASDAGPETYTLKASAP